MKKSISFENRVIIEEESELFFHKKENPKETGGTLNQKIQKETDSQKTKFTQNEEKKEVKIDNSFEIIQKSVSWGFLASNKRKIDTVIIHSSYNALGGDFYDLNKLILEYQEYQVAPHYLIDREGKIYQLVKDSNIAYHAGESKMPDGRTNVNNFSLGIELMNTKDSNFTKNQYASLNKLISFIKKNYKITSILGHNEIAPGRKTDPWNIDWDKVEK